jgi:1,2-diacylglycerol 3-alpha-glucosyltransferase
VVAGSLANEKFGTPHVFTYHGITDPRFFRNKRRKLKRELEVRALDTAVDGISTVITPTHWLAQDFTTRFGAKQTCVIPNGVDLGRFSPSASGTRIREQFGVENAPLVLYLGRITPHKGITTLCEVMDQVVKIMPNAKLMVAGKDETGFFSKQLHDHRPSYLTYAGFVPESEIVDYYSACDVYCSASLWEGFGMTFIEAMACGKPVVGFQACAIPEVVKDGKVGRLVKKSDVHAMADALVELLSDRETRRTMGRAAREYVEERYDWREIARQVLDEYAALCKGERCRHP